MKIFVQLVEKLHHFYVCQKVYSQKNNLFPVNFRFFLSFILFFWKFMRLAYHILTPRSYPSPLQGLQDLSSFKHPPKSCKRFPFLF